MNLLYSLPNHLITEIYQYENTYRKVYDLVVLEMMIKFRYVRNWEIIYNREMKFINNFYKFANDELDQLFAHF